MYWLPEHLPHVAGQKEAYDPHQRGLQNVYWSLQAVKKYIYIYCKLIKVIIKVQLNILEVVFIPTFTNFFLVLLDVLDKRERQLKLPVSFGKDTLKLIGYYQI